VSGDAASSHSCEQWLSKVSHPKKIASVDVVD
jgi:hypothetical protein